MPTPAAEADELKTPIYGLRYPAPGSKAYKLRTRFVRLAADVETIMADAGTPPVLSGTPVVAASSAARDAHWGVPANATARRTLQDLGALTIRTDLGLTERYYAGLTDGGSNPGGLATPGWYTVFGKDLRQTTYVPALTGVTIGNGSLVASYSRNGKHIHVEGALTIGSTTNVTGNVGVDTPTTMHARYATAARSILGRCNVEDVSVPTSYPGDVTSVGVNTRVALNVGSVVGGVVTIAPYGSALITEAAGDLVSWVFDYVEA